MNEELMEKLEEISMMIIANSGAARSSSFAALGEAKKGNFEEADELMERLLEQENGMVGVHRHALNADRLFCEMVGENRPEKLKELIKKIEEQLAAMG
mgnify:CR=1 FL=1